MTERSVNLYKIKIQMVTLNIVLAKLLLCREKVSGWLELLKRFRTVLHIEDCVDRSD